MPQTDKELKEQFESPRGQMRVALLALGFVLVGGSLLFILMRDPFGWFDGAPAVREAKKWIAMCVCFLWVPVIAGIWFMIIRPLQTGIVTGGSKHRAPYVVLRSEEPSRFRAHVRFNCVLLAIGIAFGIGTMISFVRDLRKAEAVPRHATPEK